MAVVTAPGRRLGRAARKRASGQLRRLRKAAAALWRPAKPVARNLASIPLTVTAFGCLGAAAIWWDPVLGLACCAPLLIALERLIADQP